MRGLKALFLALGVFSLLSFGCTRSEQEYTKEEGYLNISFQQEIRSLCPRFGIDYPSAWAIKMLFEGLMIIAPDGSTVPAIAESYELSKNKRVYTFHLKPTVWSNGDPVTAYDFVYSWKRVIDPEADALGVQNFYPIKNVKEIVLGLKSIEAVGVKALDERTLVVELEHPTPYFLDMLATPSFFPVNSTLDKGHPEWVNAQGEGFICNGPFKLDKHTVASEIVVLKNPLYWDAEKVTLKGIRISVIKDLTTQLSLFEKGKLDWLGNPTSQVPLDAIPELKKEKKLQFSPTLGVNWYFVNTEAYPFQNKKMRQAFAYAVNRQALTEYILQSEETPALSVLPLNLATQATPFFPDNDPIYANQLFEEALFEMGIAKEDLPEVQINCVSTMIHARIAEALQEQWSRVFGLPIKLEKLDWKAHYDKLRRGNYQLGSMTWLSWLRDPIYIMQTFRDKSGGVNMSHWEDPRYQQLLDATDFEIDPAKRMALFNEAEGILMDEVPVIPLYFSTISYAKSPFLKGVYLSELNDIDFRWAFFESESE